MNFNKSQFALFKNFFDLIPYPIVFLKKINFEIEYTNFSFQDFVNKSFNSLKNKSITDFFKDDLFFLSNLNEISKKPGIYLIREAIAGKKKKLDAQCIVSDKNENHIMIIFQEMHLKPYENNEDDFSAFDYAFSIITHEISNPLSSIKMASQLMEKSQKIDKELLDIIFTETKRVSNIINTISQSNNKLSFEEKTNENIHEILRYSIFKFKNEIKNINIVEEFDPSLPKIMVEKNSIIQVFDNLIKNSYESSKFVNSSYVKIKTKYLFGETVRVPNIKKDQKKNFILVSIEDNGKGIKDKQIKKIFLPFYSTKKSGLGIGLYLVKRIIDFHDGEVSIVSNKICTTALIKLPI
ncbi:MAG: nitrogen regulation protein NR(II) [Alphaproteobacteria bacterium]